MTSAFVLITAILVLGGLIAVLGDRLGSKIGKARLRLFELRPRQTATLITVVTGFFIAASTLGILFALSGSLRDGIFKLDEIKKNLRMAGAELEQIKNQKNQVEQELSSAKTEQTIVQKQLKRLKNDFKRATEQLKSVFKQVKVLRKDVQTLFKERQLLIEQRQELEGHITQLQTQLRIRDRALYQRQQEILQQDRKITAQNRKITEQTNVLQQKQIRLQQVELEQKKLQNEINQRDDKIKQLDVAISQKDNNLKQREEQLGQLEAQLNLLNQQIEILEVSYQELRERKIALVRGQVLALAVVRVSNPQMMVQVIDKILTTANQAALQLVRPAVSNSDERVVTITKSQVAELVNRLEDGQEYVVRILSAGNYVLGETQVRVVADVAPNQKIFSQGDTIAAISIDSENLTEKDWQSRVDFLLSNAQFRARRGGIVGSLQVEDGSFQNILKFIDVLVQSENRIDEVKAIAEDNTYTAGPLKLRLIALNNGEVIFSTSTQN
jgi:uncharacterized protein (DUF3084 family)